MPIRLGPLELFLILFIILVMIAPIIYVLVRIFSRGGKASKDPIGIAKERYAKGEISKAEFDEIKRAIRE